MSAVRSLSPADLDELAELVADRLEERKRARRAAATPANVDELPVSDTDRAMARGIARRLGLHVRAKG